MITREGVIRLRVETVRTATGGGNESSAIAEGYRKLEEAARAAASAIREAMNAARGGGGGGGGGGGPPAVVINEAAKATDRWAEGIKRLNAEWRSSGSGRDSFAEGLQRIANERSQAVVDEIRQGEKLAIHRRERAAEAQAAAEDQARAAEDLATRQNRAMINAGEGALRFARGLAFLSASGSESLNKLVQNVAIAQGALDVFKGGEKTLRSLQVAFGPLAGAAAAFGGVLTAGVLVWQAYREETRKAEAELKALNQVFENRINAQRRLNEATTSIRARGQTDLVDSEIVPERREAARDEQLAQITARRVETEKHLEDISKKRIAAEVGASNAERELRHLPSNLLQARFAFGITADQDPQSYVRRHEFLTEQLPVLESQKRELLTQEIALKSQLRDDAARERDIARERQRERATELQAGASGAADVFKAFGLDVPPGLQNKAAEVESLKKAEAEFGPTIRRLTGLLTTFNKEIARLENQQQALNGGK